MRGCSLRGPNAATSMTGVLRCNAGRSMPSVRFRLRRRGRRGRSEDRPGERSGKEGFKGSGRTGRSGRSGSGRGGRVDVSRAFAGGRSLSSRSSKIRERVTRSMSPSCVGAGAWVSRAGAVSVSRGQVASAGSFGKRPEKASRRKTARGRTRRSWKDGCRGSRLECRSCLRETQGKGRGRGRGDLAGVCQRIRVIDVSARRSRIARDGGRTPRGALPRDSRAREF